MSNAMFPVQPFYRSVKQLSLDSIPATWPPDLVFYCGDFDAASRHDINRSLVFVRFELNIEPSALVNCTVNVSINGTQYTLPFTMVNITPLLSLSGKNCFALWDAAIPALATVHVDEVVKVLEDELLLATDESACYVHKKEDAKRLLSYHWTQSEGIVVTELTVSLRCPLAKTKMRVPGRGIHCLHLQCFDAYAYLGLNECTLRPSWRCPVCKALVHVQDIRVDLLTLDILNKTDIRCSAVVLQADGTWQPVTSEDDRGAIGVDENLVNVESAPRDAGESFVIDLTADSDED